MKTTTPSEWLEAAEARRVCQLAAEQAIRVPGQREPESARPMLSRLLFMSRHTAHVSPDQSRRAA
jgi:hypothetical protein